jgi:hypothetical protein
MSPALSFGMAINTGALGDLTAALRDLRKKAAFHAVRLALTDTAALAHHAAGGSIEKTFTLRNKWTLGALKFDQARGTQIRQLVSRVGALQPKPTEKHPDPEPYLAMQEEGFTRQISGEHGVPVPSPAAAGQGRRARRTKPLRWGSYMSKIKLSDRPKVTKPRQAVAAAIAQAIRKHEPHVFLPLRGAPGIYRVSPRGKSRARLTLLYSLADKQIHTAPHKWLERPSMIAAQEMPNLYLRRIDAEVREIMRRRGVRPA